MKKSLVYGFLLWLICSNALYSQDDISHDSLKALIHSSAHDTVRLHAILELTYTMDEEDDVRYIALGRELAQGLAQSRSRASVMHYALDRLCLNEADARIEIFGDTYTALQMTLACLQQMGPDTDRATLAQCYNNIGVLYYYRSNLDSSLYFLNQALEIRRTLNAPDELAHGLANMGYITLRSGLLANSITYFMESLEMYEQLRDTLNMAWVLDLMGNVYVEQEDRPKALELASRRLRLVMGLNDPERLGSAYNGLAIAMHNSGQDDSATYYYELSIAQIDQLARIDFPAIHWITNYAMFLKNIGNFEDAKTAVQLAARLGESMDNFETQATVADVQSAVHLELDMPDSAIYYGRVFLKLAENSGRIDLLESAYRRLQLAHARKGEFDDAYKYLKLQKMYSDSLFNRETTQQLERNALSYQFNKRETELLAEQARQEGLAAAEVSHQKTIKNVSIAIGALLLLMAFGLYRRYRFKQRVALELEAKNIEVEAARERAERSEAFRKQFLANMSHEIRTPMNAILGMTRLLKDQDHNPKSRNYLDAVEHAANNLLVVINDVLDLSKLEAGKMEASLFPAHLSAELDMLATTFSLRAAEKDLRFELAKSPGLPAYVVTDMGRVVQILYNLLGNAIKFTDKGKVRLEVSHAPAGDGAVSINFAVSDTGVGITADKQAHIFESFGQGHGHNSRQYGGTGLGLTIARSLVELLGGRLTLESTPGVGSTFGFAITCAMSNAADREAYLQRNTFALSQQHRDYPISILLADDNEYNRLVAVDTLRKYLPHASIHTTENGRALLDLLPQKSFDLVLMDVQMPGMDGYACTKAIRSMPEEQLRNIHIVAFTASVIRSDIQRCFDAGMNGYIPKPFRDEDLLRPIAALIDKLQDGAIHTPSSAPAATEIPDSGALFMKLVPKRLALLEDALAARDVAEVKRVIHLMRPQLLESGMEEHASLIEWFEYLDEESPDPEWHGEAKKLCGLIKELVGKMGKVA